MVIPQLYECQKREEQMKKKDWNPDLEVEDDGPHKTKHNGWLSISDAGCIDVDQFDLKKELHNTYFTQEDMCCMDITTNFETP